MAFPNEIQVGRYNAILHKLLDMKEGAPAPSLAPDVFATLVLEADRPEWKFLAGERLACGSRAVAAGGAGTYANIVLWNRTGSGVLVVVDALLNRNSAARDMSISVTSTDPASVGGYSSTSFRGLRDTRFGVTANAQPAALIYSVATASPLGANVLMNFYLNAGNRFDLPIVLAPGTGLSIADKTANEAMTTGIIWRERIESLSETR